MSKFIPNRKFLGAGIAGVLAYFVTAFTGLDGEAALQITGSIMMTVMYFVPDSIGDSIENISRVLKKIGGDPETEAALDKVKTKVK